MIASYGWCAFSHLYWWETKHSPCLCYTELREDYDEGGPEVVFPGEDFALPLISHALYYNRGDSIWEFSNLFDHYKVNATPVFLESQNVWWWVHQKSDDGHPSHWITRHIWKTVSSECTAGVTNWCPLGWRGVRIIPVCLLSSQIISLTLNMENSHESTNVWILLKHWKIWQNCLTRTF